MIRNEEHSDFIRKQIFIVSTLTLISLGFLSSFSVINVTGLSMSPTIIEGDRTFIKLANSHMKHGRIIVFEKEEDSFLIKRIIGTEGDHLLIRNQFVYLNGVLLNEDYIQKPDKTILPTLKMGHDINIIIPKNQVFVMGDHRDKSWDSRHFGPISIDHIIGSLMFKF